MRSRILFWAFSFLLCSTDLSAATDIREGRVITRERFNKVVKVLIDTVKRQKELEEQVIIMQDKLREARAAGPGGGAKDAPAQLGADIPSKDDSAVDLSQLDATPAAAASPSSAHGASGGGAPHFNLYFDFWLLSQPNSQLGEGDGFTFANVHNFFLVEAVANADLKFMAEISTNPRYYEMDYQLNRWLQLRLGKIFIPFDDLQPHNLFGGRINVTRFHANSNLSTQYLPMIWADLGVGLKFTLFDRSSFSMDGHLYMVNGFRGGGTDPVTSGAPYPSFGEPSSGTSDADNNRQKSVGTRVHALIHQTVGLGVSYYAGRWTSRSQNPANLSILGLDGQLYLGRSETRIGAAFMNVGLPVYNGNPATTFRRPGYYVETSYKLGQKRHWKVLVSAGGVNGDDRVVNYDDRQIYLGKILYRPNNIEWSFEHSVDVFNSNLASRNKSITAFRVVMMF